MRGNLNFMWSNGRSEAALEAALPVPVDIRPMRRARRLRLRFDETSGTLKLTCPARMSRRSALAWALDQREWIDAQLARRLASEPVENGATIPLEGRTVRIVWEPNAAGVTAGPVSGGEAGTRWGSCSSTGRIRLSWRLILAPPEVRRYVVAHEVAHLMHLNHGAAFKALEAKLFGPGLSEAKANLRRIGPRLRRIGRRI